VDQVMRSLVYASDAHAQLICASLPNPFVRVNNRREFLAETRRRGAAIGFVDVDLLSQVEGETSNVPIVGVLDGPLADAVRALETHPWLSHVVTKALLSSPAAKSQLALFVERLAYGPAHTFVAPMAIGRVALLASSARRENRLERMREWFATQGLSPRTVLQMSDVAEELVTNALFDAPMEAGYFEAAMPRTEEVTMPPELACEISYGVDSSSVFVRVRDPFGAFMRRRLLHVLKRCNVDDGITLDESRGGAGLGLWRVFSTASSIAITVIPGRLTDILVRIETQRGKIASKSIHAVHLFFPQEQSLDGTLGRFAAEHDYDLMDESFTAVRAA
jgi:hypothetical protein